MAGKLRQYSKASCGSTASFDYMVIKSNRKTVEIQVDADARVIVRAPRRVTQAYIAGLLREKEAWILKHIEEMNKRNANAAEDKAEPLTDEELHELADKALAYIPERVAFFAEIIGVDYGRITIRNQRTRWGSCSSKGNLNFNCLLMLTPNEIIDYVVVHELCHRKEMNHSTAFWNEVNKVLPDYKSRVKWLKAEGSSIMRRLKRHC